MTTETRTEHTPGPWEVIDGITVRASAGAEDSQTGETWGGCIIAQARDTTWKWTSPATKEANARLIASAPELLAALEALYAECAMVHKHWGDESNQKQADAAIAAGKAAIAKARGDA